jgi:hypothetical protein
MFGLAPTTNPRSTPSKKQNLPPFNHLLEAIDPDKLSSSGGAPSTSFGCRSFID